MEQVKHSVIREVSPQLQKICTVAWEKKKYQEETLGNEAVSRRQELKKRKFSMDLREEIGENVELADSTACIRPLAYFSFVKGGRWRAVASQKNLGRPRKGPQNS